MTKPALYHYKLRTLHDPPEFAEFEAGPFTPYAAAMFGQMEAGNKSLHTGKTWLFEYAAIVEAEEPPEAALFPPWVRSIALWLLVGAAGGLFWELLRAGR